MLLAALERGLTMADADGMTLGQVVDFCLAYNKRQEEAAQAYEKKQKQEEKTSRKRRATQADINAWFG